MNYRQFFPSPRETQRVEWLMVYLLNNGFLLTRMGTAALSTVTTEAEIDRFGEVLFDGLRVMRRHERACGLMMIGTPWRWASAILL